MNIVESNFFPISVEVKNDNGINKDLYDLDLVINENSPHSHVGSPSALRWCDGSFKVCTVTCTCK